MKKHQYFIYIMTNKHNSVLYTGVTNSLAIRVYNHKTKNSYHESFTKKYNIEKLIYYEIFDNINNAISREKQIKSWARKRKVDLVNSMNQGWKDLYEEVPPD